MHSTIFATRTARWIRNTLGIALLLGVLSVAYSQLFIGKQPHAGQDEEKTPAVFAKLPIEPGAVEVAFTDGGNLKMLLRDDKLMLTTSHGKLVIAIRDVRCIKFATRVSEEDGKRIGAAIVDLGSAEFNKREAAGVELLKMRAKAYPALLRAAEQKDLEVVRRARELLQRIVANVPAEHLEIRKQDVIWTADSMIAGHIDGIALKAHTVQFGEVEVQLADVLRLRSQAIESEEALALMSARYGPSDLRRGASTPARIMRSK